MCVGQGHIGAVHARLIARCSHLVQQDGCLDRNTGVDLAQGSCYRTKVSQHACKQPTAAVARGTYRCCSLVMLLHSLGRPPAMAFSYSRLQQRRNLCRVTRCRSVAQSACCNQGLVLAFRSQAAALLPAVLAAAYTHQGAYRTSTMLSSSSSHAVSLPDMHAAARPAAPVMQHQPEPLTAP